MTKTVEQATASHLEPTMPVDSLTPETALRVLVAACEAVHQSYAGAELIRIGSNAVYRLPGPAVARIAQDPTAFPEAAKQVAVARWLAAEDYPAVHALDVQQPVNVGGRVTTFWESASETEEYAPIDQVAALIRRLHELPAPESFTLPEYRPFDRGEASIDAMRGVPDWQTSFMRERLVDLRESYSHLEFTLPQGPIHGDANVGNVILGRSGHPVLIDLDSFAIGPREWDLVQTALYWDRFGWHTDQEYRTFVDVYGFDVTEWPGYQVLADTREIMMTAWLGRMADTNDRAAIEVTKRIEAIKTGATRRDWAPF
jgi:aminoglycoside phosphotransferase (APT) family kinase protein